MEFFEALTQALAQNNGHVSLEQGIDLLPDSQKHRFMQHLNSARNSGVCSYSVSRVDGQLVLDIANPAPSVPVGGNS